MQGLRSHGITIGLVIDGRWRLDEIEYHCGTNAP
jgi:hypothetical protein